MFTRKPFPEKGHGALSTSFEHLHKTMFILFAKNSMNHLIHIKIEPNLFLGFMDHLIMSLFLLNETNGYPKQKEYDF